MNILAIDCHKRNFNLCISHEKGDFFIESNEKSEYIAPLIKSLFEKHEIMASDFDFFCVCKGPGSFTGLRAGLSFILGLSCGKINKLRAVPTFKAYAKAAEKHGIVDKDYFSILKSGLNDFFVYLPDNNSVKLLDKNDILEYIKGKNFYNGENLELCNNAGIKHFGTNNLSKEIVEIILNNETEYTDISIEYMKRPAINMKRRK